MKPLLPLLMMLGLVALPFATGAYAAPAPDDEETEEVVEEEVDPEDDFLDEPAEDDPFYADGLDQELLDEEEALVDPDAEGTYFWGVRGDDFGLLAYDILNDNIPSTFELSPWDQPMHDEERFAPTEDEIQAKINDEEFSPLKNVLSEGPVMGLAVPLFVLVPDQVLEGTGYTGGVPNAATYKAMQLADQLTNGVAFTYTSRTDTVVFNPGPQQVVPQLQYIDVQLYQGVVKFFFNLGMEEGLYASKSRGRSYVASATAPAQDISTGYDLALERALHAAARKAVGAAIQGSGAKAPDTITGRIDYFEIVNEGWWEESNEFEVTVKAYVTTNIGGSSMQSPPSLMTPSAGPAIIELDGSDDSSSDDEYYEGDGE